MADIIEISMYMLSIKSRIRMSHLNLRMTTEASLITETAIRISVEKK